MRAEQPFFSTAINRLRSISTIKAIVDPFGWGKRVVDLNAEVPHLLPSICSPSARVTTVVAIGGDLPSTRLGATAVIPELDAPRVCTTRRSALIL